MARLRVVESEWRLPFFAFARRVWTALPAISASSVMLEVRDRQVPSSPRPTPDGRTMEPPR